MTSFHPRFHAAALALLGLLLFLSGSICAESKPINIKDTQGRSMKVRLITCDGLTVRVSRERDRRVFTIPLATLDQASQKLVKEWVDAGGSLSDEFEVVVNTGRTRRKDGSEDYDDKRVNLNPEITIKNPNNRLPSCPCTLTVLFFGRPVKERSHIYVLARQSFEVAEIQPLSEEIFRMDEISQAYDDNGYAQFGSRYLGYAVFLHDEKEVKIYSSSSVPGTLVSSYSSGLLKLEAKGTYDRYLKEVN